MFQVQPDQLRIADAAAIQQLEDYSIPCRPRGCLIIGCFAVQRAIHLLDRRHTRQMLRELRGRDQRGRILRHMSHPRQPFEPGAHRCQCARGRRFREPAIIQGRQVRADVQMLDTPDVAVLAKLLREVGNEAGQFALVRTQSVGGRAALTAQHREIAVSQIS